jgi:hypothetical protein
MVGQGAARDFRLSTVDIHYSGSSIHEFKCSLGTRVDWVWGTCESPL